MDSTDSPIRLTAVIPCYNEQDNVLAAYREIVAELGRYDLEILFVDDGSRDDTLRHLRDLAAADPRVAFLSFYRNYGFEAAFSAGFCYASHPWILQLDADLQFPPDQAHLLVDRAAEEFDVVYAVRRQRHDPLWRRGASLAFHTVASRLLGIDIPYRATTFRLIRTEVARRIVELRLPVPYFMATVPWLTRRVATVPVAHRPRAHGRSRFRPGWLVGHALDLYFGFSPRVGTMTAAALVVSSVGVCVAVMLDAAGLTSSRGTLCVALVALAVLLLAASVAARYLATLVRVAQRRPLFLIREASIEIDPADRLYPASQPAGGFGVPR